MIARKKLQKKVFNPLLPDPAKMPLVNTSYAKSNWNDLMAKRHDAINRKKKAQEAEKRPF